MSAFLLWLCRTCKQSFKDEQETAAHVRETGHTEISLRRSR